MTASPRPAGSKAFALARGAVAVFAFTFLLGAHCHWHGHSGCDDDWDDDDFDDDDCCCDDDDDVIIVLDDEGSAPYRLRDYVRKELNGRTLFDSIEDVGLSAVAGPPPYEAAVYADFAERVLDSNRPLLGPDPAFGSLVLREMLPAGERLLVVFEQRAETLAGSTETVPDAEVVLLFDALGALRVIEDRSTEALDRSVFSVR